MTTYLRNPRRITTINYFLYFDRIAAPGSGYSFPCRSDGVVDTSEMSLVARGTLAALRGELANEFRAPAVQSSTSSHFDAGSVRCGCGHEHDLDRHDSECDNCGQLFNAVGQKLRPRAEWEENLEESI